jgi:broad specificity phosphatase PhoE
MVKSFLMPPSLSSFTFLRHGESLGNARGISQGQADFPLTEVGIQQARDLVARWQQVGIQFDRIISSPLKRARQTAEIIAEALQVPIDFDSNWMERSFGNLEGVPFAEVTHILPPTDFFFTYPPIGGDGESLPTLFERAHLAIDKLVNCPPGRYLVVSHGVILNVALLAILGLEPQPEPFKARFSFGNTAYASLSYDPALNLWKIISLDNQSHRIDRVE